MASSWKESRKAFATPHDSALCLTRSWKGKCELVRHADGYERIDRYHRPIDSFVGLWLFRMCHGNTSGRDMACPMKTGVVSRFKTTD